MEQTKGEQRVRIRFNPSSSDAVFGIKQKAAELINVVNAIGTLDHDVKDMSAANEQARLKSLAMTSFEEGAMWAVKAATI